MLQLSLRVTGRQVAAPVAVSVRPRSTAAAAPITTTSTRSDEWALAKPFAAMPGPDPFPIFGNLPRFLPKVGQYGGSFLKSTYALREQYGDLVRVIGIPGKENMVFAFDPKYAETAFRNEGKWPMRKGVNTIHYYRSVERKDKYEGALGTVTTQGKEWGEFRTKVNQPLMQRKSTNKYFLPVNDVTSDFIARMRDLRDDKMELPEDFINELYKWALESITMVALDTRLGCLDPDLKPDSEPQRVIESVHVMLNALYALDVQPSIWRLVSTPTWRGMVKAMDYFGIVADKYIAAAVAKRGENPNRELSILEKLMAEDPKVARVMTSDLLFGGVDTTSHLSGSLLFHLATNPDKQKKLAEEVHALLPSKDTPVTEEVVNELPYLKACLKESLRIFPIAQGNSREMPEDIVLGGYQVPKGTNVFMCHMVMSRDERHFPRPLAFEPERWLRGPTRHAAHPFASQPFGFGPRMCVGRRFAEMETITLVAKVIRNFWVEYHYGNELQFESKALNSITSPLKFRLIDKD